MHWRTIFETRSAPQLSYWIWLERCSADSYLTATQQLIDRTCPAAQRLHGTGCDCENAFAHHIVARLPGKKAIGVVSLDGSAVGALLVWGVAVKAVTTLPGCSF